MLTQPRGTASGLILGLSLVASHAAAQAPTTVGVRVELVAPSYKDHFTQRTVVETAAAKLFTNFLRENVGFLRFAIEDPLPPYRLVFQLDRSDRASTASFAEVGFWVRLDRPTNVPLELYWLPFRSADQSLDGVGTADEFLAEISTKLSHAGPGLLRDSILKHAPITETALPNLNPPGWALPFRLLDLCMKNQSQLQVVAEIQNPMSQELVFDALIVGAFNVPGPPPPAVQPFLGNGFGKAILKVPDELTPSIAQGTIRVKQVFVVFDVHDPNACRNRQPGPVGGGIP